MSKLNDYLTIKEVAKQSGKSSQYIYKELNNRFATFLKVVDNKKYLHKDVLKIIGSTVEKEDAQQDEQQDKQTINQVEKQGCIDFNKTLQLLNEQLKSKDKQIDEKDKQIASLTQLLSQQQSLQLNQQKMYMLNEGNEKKPKKSWWQRHFNKVEQVDNQ